MNKRLPILLHSVAWLAIACAIVPLGWLVWREPDNLFLLRIWSSHKVPQFTAGWHSVDDIVNNAPGTADVAMIFTRFGSQDRQAWQLAEETSHRGAYTLYPRKLIVADDGVTLGGGEKIINGHFNPSVAWLQEHKVGTLFEYTVNPDGSLRVNMAQVPPLNATVNQTPAGGR